MCKNIFFLWISTQYIFYLLSLFAESSGKRKLDEDSDENSASKHLHVDLQDTDSYEVESFVAMASDREMTARKVKV